MKDKLTVYALMAVMAFGLLGQFQVLNVLLAIPAVAGLVMLLTDRRLPLGLAAGAICLGLAFLIDGQYLLIETAMLVIMPSAIIALCIKANREPGFAIVMVLIPILILSLSFLISVGETGAYFQKIAPGLESNLRETADMLGLVKGDSQMNEDYIAMSMKMMKYLIRFLPAIMLTIFTALATLSYKLAEYGFRKEGRYMIPFPHFSRWKIKDSVLIFFGIGLIMVLLDDGIFGNVGENVAVYAFILFSLGGLSLVESYLQKKKATGLMKFMIYFSLVILNIYGAIVLGVMGLIDSHFDFRRLRALRIG